MSKPEDISQEAWDAAYKWLREPVADIHGNHLLYFLSYDFERYGLKVIARAIMAAKAEEREAIAAYVEGKGGVIPGAAVFAPLVSRNNQPCMSGDPRDRLNTQARRDFDDSTAALATAIRKRGAA